MPDGVPDTWNLADPSAIDTRSPTLAEIQPLLDHVPDIIARYDRAHRVCYVSRGIEAATGRPEHEFIGKTATEAGIPLSRLDWWEDALERVFTTGEPSTVEFELATASGTRWFSTRLVPERGEGGDVVSVISWSREVTEGVIGKRRLEESEANVQRAQKMEAVGQLAGGVAHDFNNLLTAILNNVELGLAQLPNASSGRNELEEIGRAARQAAGLTRKLLTISGPKMRQARPLDLNKLVRECEPILRRVLGETGTLETDLASGLGAVHADPSHIELVLANLVGNARDAMPGGGKVTITTSTLVVAPGPVAAGPGQDLSPGSYVNLAVHDTGAGMDADTQLHIFEPFFTTKPVGQGTGLGLAMVYGVVTQSGGAIRVESVPGEGSTFTLIFPEVAAAVAPDAVAIQAIPPGRETILLVEDEGAVRSSARLLLERHGYKVIEAKHGAEALRVWREHQPGVDLLVTDMRMPEIGGRELARLLRAERPSLPVVFMSGYSRDEEAPIISGPLDAVLQKPFEIGALLQKLREVLDAGPEHRQLAV